MRVTNIIQRRDLEPLWHKANEVVRHYEKAVDCISAVVSADCVSIEHSKHPKANIFCMLCKRYHLHASKLAPHEYPCTSMHCVATKKARKIGSYVYACPVGLFFWNNPFFAGKRYAGTCISCAIPVIGREKALDRMFKICKGEISHAELAQHIDEFPARSEEEVQALAQMMQFCSQQISRNTTCWFDLAKHGYKPEASMPDLLDKERLLLASLQRGDYTDAQGMVRDLMYDMNAISGGDFEHFRLKAIELVATLSRTGSNSENSQELIEANNRYLKRIGELKTTEEITDYMCRIVEQMSGKIFSFRGLRHTMVLRKAERFIRENYARKISLREIADASGLSAPYFSTIFKEEMGENLSSYLNRLRVEKACSMLRETNNPINGISANCGFDDQGWFSKIFKIYTGVSPCKYRKHGACDESK